MIVWDLEGSKPVGRPLAFPGVVSRAAFSDNRRLALAGSDGTVRVYKVNPPAAEAK
ncbi:MAG TPA: hypothetical protein VFA26_05760 [Gemmataceae bacterium]|nr:hypothetical protein [Gemmataceae bacterium]